MDPAVGGGAEVLLFCPDITETSTISRARGFLEAGCAVSVFGFRRARYNDDYRPDWPCVALGRTADGRYLQRLAALLGALPRVLREGRRLRRARALYARNLDQLLLVLLARRLVGSRAPVAYEVLDVSPALTAAGRRAALLRALERFCLARAALLVLSSPGFHRNYFARLQGYQGPWFLLENKLHPAVLADSAAPVPRRARDGRPWVIGCFGLIRGEATLELVGRLAERLGPQVEFRFRGVLTTVRPERFEALLRRCPNVVYGGPYSNPRDLASIYGAVDFAWAIDLEHADHNSRWLLPCRFYEAGHFGVPCLAVRGFEVGELVERLGVGWSFEPPLEEALSDFFMQLTPEDYEARRRRLLAQPRERFLADGEPAELLERLEGPAEDAPRRAQPRSGRPVSGLLRRP